MWARTANGGAINLDRFDCVFTDDRGDGTWVVKACKRLGDGKDDVSILHCGTKELCEQRFRELLARLGL